MSTRWWILAAACIALRADAPDFPEYYAETLRSDTATAVVSNPPGLHGLLMDLDRHSYVITQSQLDRLFDRHGRVLRFNERHFDKLVKAAREGKIPRAK